MFASKHPQQQGLPTPPGRTHKLIAIHPSGSATGSARFRLQPPPLGRKVPRRRAVNFMPPPLTKNSIAHWGGETTETSPRANKTRKFKSKKTSEVPAVTSTGGGADPISNTSPHSLAPRHCPVRPHDDPLSFSLYTYDTLVSASISDPPKSTASLIAIRRNIYRKQLNDEALRLIHASNAPPPSVDELVQIVHLPFTSCGLILM